MSNFLLVFFGAMLGAPIGFMTAALCGAAKSSSDDDLA